MTARLPTSKRPARVLVCIIVCMGIAISIMSTSMRTALQMRRQMQRELQMEQTRWLLRAAISRVVHRTDDDSQYAGETWDIHLAVPTYDQAVLEIQLKTTQAGDQMIAATSRIGDTNQLATFTQCSGHWIQKSITPEANE